MIYNSKHTYIRRGALSIGILVVAVCLIQALRSTQTFVLDQNAYYPVSYVVDGDTFKVRAGNREITVRLLGINTPETVDPRKPVQCFGPEASHETKSLLTGMNVQLKLNPQREVTDKYGRYLAYAYLSNGISINRLLIEQGFAREYTVGKPYSFQKQFKALELEAQQNKRGLWGACASTTKI